MADGPLSVITTPESPPIARPTAPRLHLWQRLVATLFICAGILSGSYATLSVYLATQLVYVPQKPVVGSPADAHLAFADITFPSRGDHLMLKGWFIPGVGPDGSLTTARTIIVVHGSRANRVDKGANLLGLSEDLVRQGFAVLTFDMRGSGESPPAPLSLGYFEQRDVLGAVDYLRGGPLPFTNLARPQFIGALGISMGAATALFAAAQEPAIRAVVSDCAFADIIPILEREIPKQGHVPALFTPGGLLASQALYGIDYYADRPVDVISQIAPRPLFFIHGARDGYIPPSNMDQLAAAARAAPGAQVQTWLVPGAGHAQSFKTAPDEYVQRVTAFFDQALR